MSTETEGFHLQYNSVINGGLAVLRDSIDLMGMSDVMASGGVQTVDVYMGTDHIGQAALNDATGIWSFTDAPGNPAGETQLLLLRYTGLYFDGPPIAPTGVPDVAVTPTGFTVEAGASVTVINAGGNPTVLDTPSLIQNYFNVTPGTPSGQDTYTYIPKSLPSAGIVSVQITEPGATGPESPLGLPKSIFSPLAVDNIAGAGTVMYNGTSGTDDQQFGIKGIGFTFSYFGNDFTQFSASSNGIVHLGGTASDTFSNTALSSDGSQVNSLFPFWDDLYGTTGKMSYEFLTAADAANHTGHDVMVIDWYNWEFWEFFPADHNWINFQAVLVKDTNQVIFEYFSPMGSNGRSSGNSATIGIKGNNNAQYSQISFNTAHIAAGEQITFTPSGPTTYSSTDVVLPAGVAGSPINLAITDASQGQKQGLLHLHVTGVPDGWTLSAGTRLADGSWSVDAADPSTLTVKTPVDFAGAQVLTIDESWTNPDGTTGTTTLIDNVEAYARGSAIFAWSGADTLTGSAARDTFVFGQPIGSDTIYKFDVAKDHVDLMGFAGFKNFADIHAHLSADAQGNALLTLGAGETITFMGVDFHGLGARNFTYNVNAVTHNAHHMEIGDGAMLPLGGLVHNSGAIDLNAAGHGATLEIIANGLTLNGGGRLVLSDDDGNVITGSTASMTLTNINNTISGAGHLGNGQLTLNNHHHGTIDANGSHALIIDTGANTIVNAGTMEATGAGGLIINSALLNNGLLEAINSHLTINGDLSGKGSVALLGTATVEFGGAASEDVHFGPMATGTLELDTLADFTGRISGFNNNDTLDFKALAFSGAATAAYVANHAGTGGTLTVGDGIHTTAIALLGQYDASAFHTAADATGGMAVTYHH